MAQLWAVDSEGGAILVLLDLSVALTPLTTRNSWIYQIGHLELDVTL